MSLDSMFYMSPLSLMESSSWMLTSRLSSPIPTLLNCDKGKCWGEWGMGIRSRGFLLTVWELRFYFFITFEMNNRDSKQGLFHFAE